ncbi:MAG: hypothetical protein Q8O72_13235 [Bacteroidales bacterium]|jgi:hypothetical protein|nr:hypothetical protein [Bacteroidales bacterium]
MSDIFLKYNGRNTTVTCAKRRALIFFVLVIACHILSLGCGTSVGLMVAIDARSGSKGQDINGQYVDQNLQNSANIVI